MIDAFTRNWERGEGPRAEDYLHSLTYDESAELIYHEFCLGEAAGHDPDPAEYLLRFPEHSGSLGRLFALHRAFSASTLRGWAAPTDFPSSGDDIGPYHLIRELGRGSFARVFLAEQTDLENRLVVLKVATRASAEPQLLARACHAHIAEVLRHAETDDGALHLFCMPFLGGATLASVLERSRARERRPESGLNLLADLDQASAPEYASTPLDRPTREMISRLSYNQAIAWILARLSEALDHAHQKGVTHGDIKPSNILLTAEARPVLFDFNLSIDWRATRPRDYAGLGGTMAYMAPERLDSLSSRDGAVPRDSADLHRADLYSLGLLLLEALTGRIVEIPSNRRDGRRQMAARLLSHRQNLTIDRRALSDLSIPPSLCGILSKCLAPDPILRYDRGNHLALDLDTWRCSGPPAYAADPAGSTLIREI